LPILGLGIRIAGLNQIADLKLSILAPVEPNTMQLIYRDVLLQSPPHLVNNDAALLRYPWEQNNAASQSSSIDFSFHNSTPHWSNSYPPTTSACQQHVNTETAPAYNSRLCEAATSVHPMTLRPSSDLESTVFHDLLDCDVYDPELNVAENPEYFHINSMLFTAHQLRSQRYGRSFFENWTIFMFNAVCDIVFIFILYNVPIFLMTEGSIILWMSLVE